MRILVAVDGSKPSLKAVQLLIDHADWYRDRPEVELVTVHLPVPKVAHLNKAQVEKYYSEEGEAMLTPAKKKLELGAALVGSTATKVLHISETPVLLVK
jgi:nucleotide-binding universal stress UspA family protein